MELLACCCCWDCCWDEARPLPLLRCLLRLLPLPLSCWPTVSTPAAGAAWLMGSAPLLVPGGSWLVLVVRAGASAGVSESA